MTRASDDIGESASLLTDDTVATARVKKADEWQLLGHDVLGRIFEFLGNPLSNPKDFSNFRRLNKLCLTVAHGVTKYPIPAHEDRYPMSALLFLRKLYNAGFGTADQILRNDAYFSVPHEYTLTKLRSSSNFHELLKAMNEKKDEYALLFGEQYNTLREKEKFSFYCRYRIMQLSEHLFSTLLRVFFISVISLMLTGYYIYLNLKQFGMALSLFQFKNGDEHCKDFTGINLTSEITNWLIQRGLTTGCMQEICSFASKRCNGIYSTILNKGDNATEYGVCPVSDPSGGIDYNLSLSYQCVAITGIETARAVFFGPAALTLTFMNLIAMLNIMLSKMLPRRIEHHVTSTLMNNLHRLFAHPHTDNTTAVSIQHEESRSDLEN